MKTTASPTTLKVTFTSDWHVGDGAGVPGYIDRIVRRDPQDQLPYLPAKTLTGIWRDACEQVAAGLDGGGASRWQTLVDTLFGNQPSIDQIHDQTPQPARLALRPARLPSNLREKLRENQALRAALTFIKPGVRIDAATGQALDDHLRFEEMVRAGAVLEAPLELALDDLDAAQRDAALALLWAGAQVVERLGGNRRRGAGECKFQLVGLEDGFPAAALARLNQDPPAVPPGTRPVDQSLFSNSSDVVVTSADSSWLKLSLRLKLLTPVVAAQNTIGNVIQSLDYLPGSYLLSALSERLDHEVFAQAARGDFRVSNAYPEVANVRGLPVPLALFHDKEQGGLDKPKGQTWNRLKEAEPGGDIQLKQYRGGYLGPFDGVCRPVMGRSRLQLTTHGTIEDRYQRPTEAVGGVFTYQALAAGQRLRAEIWVRGPLKHRWIDENWRQKLHGQSLRLGRSKKDDYGWVELQVLDDTTPSAAPDPRNADGELCVWLLSDVLLRDATLRSSTALEVLRQALEQQLKKLGHEVKLTVPDTPEAVWLRTRRGDGWHQSWGLPRPSYIGFAAGSCVRFTATPSLDQKVLQALMEAGIGERRAEGFGDLACNPPLLAHTGWGSLQSLDSTAGDEAENPAAMAGHAPTVPITTTDPGIRGFIRTLETAAWRTGIQNAALKLAGANRRAQFGGWTSDRIGDRIIDKPTNSQLGTLRALLGQIQRFDDADTRQRPTPGVMVRSVQTNAHTDRRILQRWLDHIEATPNQSEKWPRQTLKILRDLIADQHENRVWEWLEEAEPTAFPILLFDSRTGLRRTLWAEALRALWIAAIQAEQRQRESE